jgi:hypothetical protein
MGMLRGNQFDHCAAEVAASYRLHALRHRRRRCRGRRVSAFLAVAIECTTTPRFLMPAGAGQQQACGIR